jgi:hypothetical protein
MNTITILFTCSFSSQNFLMYISALCSISPFECNVHKSRDYALFPPSILRGEEWSPKVKKKVASTALSLTIAFHWGLADLEIKHLSVMRGGLTLFLSVSTPLFSFLLCNKLWFLIQLG